MHVSAQDPLLLLRKMERATLESAPAAIYELHREIEHDQQRKHGEADEHGHHARFQLRARYMVAIIAQQPREIADQQGVHRPEEQ